VTECASVVPSIPWPRVLSSGIALALIITTGCGEGRESPSAAPVGTPSPTASPGVSGSTVTFSLVEFSITPSSIVLPAGVPITFIARNDGTGPHSLSVRTKDVHLFTALAHPHDSQTMTGALAPGTYRFICPVDNHANLGMVATVTVLK
jgi:plastocyanin